MEFCIWHYWLIATILLFVFEIFTPSFVMFNFGIGTLIATLAAILGLGIEWQVILFCIATLISFFVIRPLAVKYAYRKSDHRPTNNLALIGRKGEVITAIDNEKNRGEIKVDGDIWRAKTINNETVEVGTIVTIVKLESIIVFVEVN